MGALHSGHLSLMERACQENDTVVVSIFVNPLQFGPQEDLARYPRDLAQDQQQCEDAGIDVLFAPTPEELYGISLDTAELVSQLTQVIPPISMTTRLCGRSRSVSGGESRPGHFQGVATVVTKLLSLVQPTRVYLGQKDAQQLAIIRRLAQDLNLPGEIVACPIVRESSGLALSSRNIYLTPEQREQATILYRSLQTVHQSFQAGERQTAILIQLIQDQIASTPTVKLDYAEIVDPETLAPLTEIHNRGLVAIAAYVGSTRLIDNLVLSTRKPIIAIDGPAGAGKSTITRHVAQALSLLYLDTGAMYRAVTWLVLEQGISLDDEPTIAELIAQAQIEFKFFENPEPSATQVWINGQDVTQAIRQPHVTAKVSAIAAQGAVRTYLVQQQRAYGRRGGLVAEGRDIGTAVFPDAELKIFLTASIQERARRRQGDLQALGQPSVDLAKLELEIAERDRKDSSREISPLVKAADAIEIQTDGLTIEAVTQKIIELYTNLVL
jgi:pantoate ligase/cytidylate kinase